MNTNKSPLLNSIQFGPYTLKNRVVMAAMTRMRANPLDGIPQDIHVKYYSERASSAGLVLTECSPISKQAEGFPGAAGIYTDEQVEGWKKVTEAVHNVGGKIYIQLWHSGRANRANPVAPSPIGMRIEKHYPNEVVDKIPKELNEEEILGIVEDFRNAALNAQKAGFDGIELHGGNGYLIDEFLRDGTNSRTDHYGGSIENRSRFPLMVIDAVISVFGEDRVGIKFSPVSRYQDMYDSDPEKLMIYILGELSKRKVSFVEISRAPLDSSDTVDFYNVNGADQMPTVCETLRPYFNGIYITNSEYDWKSGNQIVNDAHADMVSFARNFIANPDLVERYSNGWDLNRPDFSKVYHGGAEGFCDYEKYQSN